MPFQFKVFPLSLSIDLNDGSKQKQKVFSLFTSTPPSPLNIRRFRRPSRTNLFEGSSHRQTDNVVNQIGSFFTGSLTTCFKLSQHRFYHCESFPIFMHLVRTDLCEGSRNVSRHLSRTHLFEGSCHRQTARDLTSRKALPYRSLDNLFFVFSSEVPS